MYPAKTIKGANHLGIRALSTPECNREDPDVTSYPCPFCGAAATLDAGCPACGRAPDPEAAEVIRLGAEIVTRTAAAEQARLALAAADGRLREAQLRRNALAARVMGRVRAETRTPATTTPAAGPAAAPVAVQATVRPEASTRTVQTVLFVLGGLLLGTAAIVFTAVAWATFGVQGRAVILGSLTALALAAPLPLVRRGLTATAETFAAVGLLLVLLDGYAAWYVNLFGVADGSARTYAGLVCAVTTAVAAAYGAMTGLVGPRFAMLLAAQPVLPLLVARSDPSATGWGFVFAAVAAMDAGAAGWWSRAAGRSFPAAGGVRLALRACAWTLFGGALLISGARALAGLGQADGAYLVALAGAALVTAALVLTAGAVIARRATFQSLAGAALVLALAVAGSRLLLVVWPDESLLPLALVAAGLAVAVAAVGRVLPVRVRTGPRVAALVVTGLVALLATVGALAVAQRTARAAMPAFAADLTPVGRWDWQPPAALALVALALILLLPGRARVDVVFGAAALVVLGAPAGVRLPWWGPAMLAAVGAGAFALAAVRSRAPASTAVCAAAAAAVGSYALLAGLGRAGSTAVVLAVLLVAGMLSAGLGIRASTWHGRLAGGVALTAGLLAWPGMVAAGLAAMRVEPWWVARSTVIASAVLVVGLALVAHGWRPYRWYAFAAALTAAFLCPVWAVVGGTGEPAGLYAAVALLLIAAAVTVMPAEDAMLIPAIAAGVGVVPALWCAAAVAPALGAVLLEPYGWLDTVWRGRPAGTGLSPFREPAVAVADAVALVVVSAAVALPLGRRVARRVAGWAALPLLGLALPVGLAAGEARWPAVPAAALLLGLAALLTSALTGSGRSWGSQAQAPGSSPERPKIGWTLPVPVVVGAALVGSGLAGSLPTRGTTLAALGLALAAATVVGAAGRTVAVRVAGWLSAVPAGLLLALASAQAAGLDRRWSAYAVLATAALALGLGALLRSRRSSSGSAVEAVEAVAVDAAAQAGAVTALLLSVHSARHAAAICTLWGIVLGLRALWPQERSGRRLALVTAAAAVEVLAWWLLMAAEQVALLEAYTLPAAAVGLLAGWLALRGRPGLSSWLAYGPALAAALLPSLASVLVDEGVPLRRLLLGVGALVAVLAGSAWRRQAPVVVGGSVLAAVALHELALVWDLLPRWIPLAAAGMLLVGLAMTLERRRRDLARVRDAVGRMT
jgi:hypothetical protein